MRIVIALGGNALLRRSDPMTTEVQRKNVRIAATTSPLDSTPAEIRPRLPVAMPVPSLSTTRNAAAAIETRAVVDWPREAIATQGTSATGCREPGRRSR